MNKFSELSYLASPYSKFPGGRQQAYYLACSKAMELMKDGKRVFCPIAHSHSIEIESGSEIMDGDWWLQQDFAVLNECKELLVYKMPGWDTSYGVQKEIQYAEWNNIPIRYLEFEDVQQPG